MAIKTVAATGTKLNLLQFLSQLNAGEKLTNVAEYAREFECTYSEMRTAFNFALANGYIRSMNSSNQRTFVRTRKSIRLA